MTTSPAGIYGNFGQTNYSSAKLGLVGLSNTLAVEGAKYNIHCNSIAPVAASRLTEDIFPENFMDYFKPSYVAPVVVWLSHETCPENGGVFETAGGYVGKYRWQRSNGKVFSSPNSMTPESVRDFWPQITDMSRSSAPNSFQEHTLNLVNALKANTENNGVTEELNSEVMDKYSVDDVILYALSVGVSTREPKHLKFLYECSEEFSVLPSYGAVIGLKAVTNSSIFQDALKAYNIRGDLTKLLHGEHYLEVLNPIPSSASLSSKPKVIDVLDKGSGALIIVGVDTYDENGVHLFYNQLSLFLIGSGNFGGQRMSDNNTIQPIVKTPNREPDAIVSEKTSIDQAAIYRLCGDKNPLHIDPMFAAVGGFSSPILHGLCTMGFALRHVLSQYCDYDVQQFKSLKTRFVGPLTPGETIETRMWKEGNRVHFESLIKESGKTIISGAYVDLIDKKRNYSGTDSSFEYKNEDIIGINRFSDIESSNNWNEENIKFICAPYQGNDGQGGGDDGPSSRVDKIFGGWLSVRISEHKELVPIIKTVYQWNILQNGKVITVWTLDLKNGGGSVYKGSPKTGKADCVLNINEETAVNVFEGREDAMKAFMSGRLKISGNILAAQKLQQLWSEEAPRGSVSIEKQAVTPSVNLEDKTLLESVPVSGLKSDIVFTVFRNRIHEEPDLVRKLRVIFQFNITIDGKIKTIWTTDNKTTIEGQVYTGAPKHGKPDCIVNVEDNDFVKLMFGKLNPQRAFMMGKLKVKGNIMLLQKLNSLWLDLQKAGKAPELPFLTEMMLKTTVVPGLRSESMIIELVQRLVRLPNLCTELATLVGLNITKGGQSVSKWTLDFTKNKLSGVFDRGLPDKKYCILTIDDDDFVRLTFNRISLQDGISSGRIKVEGDPQIPKKIGILFTTPTTKSKL